MRRAAIGWSITRSIPRWCGGPVAGFWLASPPMSRRSALASSMRESASGFILSCRCSTFSQGELTFTGYARTKEDRLFLVIALSGRQGIRAIEFERLLEGRTQISPEFGSGFALGIYAGDFCHPANPPSRVLFND